MLRGRIGPKANMVVLGVLVISLGFALNYPAFRGWMEVPPLQYHNIPFPVVNQPVRPGHVIPLVISRCNVYGESLSYVVTRSLYKLDSSGASAFWISLGEIHVEIAPGCTDGVSNLHVFPKEVEGATLESGTYVLEGTSIVQTEWKTHYIKWKTQPFKVVVAGGQ